MTNEAPVLVPRTAVEQRFGLSKSTIYKLMAAGTFPRPVKISPGCVRWRVADLEEWEATRPTADFSEGGDED